jgi:hypothetical protein
MMILKILSQMAKLGLPNGLAYYGLTLPGWVRCSGQDLTGWSVALTVSFSFLSPSHHVLLGSWIPWLCHVATCPRTLPTLSNAGKMGFLYAVLSSAPSSRLVHLSSPPTVTYNLGTIVVGGGFDRHWPLPPLLPLKDLTSSSMPCSNSLHGASPTRFDRPPTWNLAHG